MKKLLFLSLVFAIVTSINLTLPQLAKAEYYHKVITVEDRFITGSDYSYNYALHIITKQREYFTTREVPYGFLKLNRKCKVQINSTENVITDIYQCYN